MFKDVVKSLSKCVRVEVHGLADLQDFLREIQMEEEKEKEVSLSILLSPTLSFSPALSLLTHA